MLNEIKRKAIEAFGSVKDTAANLIVSYEVGKLRTDIDMAQKGLVRRSLKDGNDIWVEEKNQETLDNVIERAQAQIDAYLKPAENDKVDNGLLLDR